MIILFLKLMNYYGYKKYFWNKVVSQSRRANNTYSSCTNVLDFYKEICNTGKLFEKIKLVIKRVLVIPVISVAAERSFSTMRRIKKLTSLPK
jgi:hypothetical protein